MSQTLLSPTLGLDREFPERVYVLHHSATKRYGCYCHEGIHGLACFSSPAGARRFGEHIELDGLSVLELSFDDAREVAKLRPLPVTSLMLLDDINSPLIHFIR